MVSLCLSNSICPFGPSSAVPASAFPVLILASPDRLSCTRVSLCLSASLSLSLTPPGSRWLSHRFGLQHELRPHTRSRSPAPAVLQRTFGQSPSPLSSAGARPEFFIQTFLRNRAGCGGRGKTAKGHAQEQAQKWYVLHTAAMGTQVPMAGAAGWSSPGQQRSRSPREPSRASRAPG